MQKFLTLTGLAAHLPMINVDTDKIITHSADLDSIAPAIERVLNREDDVIKTVIKP